MIKLHEAAFAIWHWLPADLVTPGQKCQEHTRHQEACSDERGNNCLGSAHGVKPPTPQAQQPGLPDATIATVTRWPGSLQRMVLGHRFLVVCVM